MKRPETDLDGYAVAGLTKTVAVDHATQGVRANAIAPGLMRARMTERLLNDPKMRGQVLADSPICRVANLEDVAAFVLSSGLQLGQYHRWRRLFNPQRANRTLTREKEARWPRYKTSSC